MSTPDARVVVHGTVFSVHVDSDRARGKQTCVEVTDGVVIVQHDGSETALNSGDQWGCDRAPKPSPTPAAEPSAAAPNESRTATRTAPLRVAHPPEPGTLGEETRLFQSALAAERLGRRAQAQTLLEQLLSTYPSSPLAAEAGRALSRVAVHPAGR